MNREHIAEDLGSARLAMRTMVHGCLYTQLIYTAARLGIADLLATGAKSPGDLAEATETEPNSLYRLLRALASLGVFAETEDGRFELTLRGELLQKDIPGSLHAPVILWGELFYPLFGGLEGAVQSGQSACERHHGAPFYGYLEQNPAAAAIFDAAMNHLSTTSADTVLSGYDFSAAGTIVDVGGGLGTMLAKILEAHPHARGVLFDMPGVIERARERLDNESFASRCELVAGDFLAAIPGGGDTYILKGIIHNWDDERALAILRNCHAAMTKEAKILVMERLIPAGNEPALSKVVDITMLAITGGMARTRDQLEALLGAAGFTLERVFPTDTEICILEGRIAR